MIQWYTNSLVVFLSQKKRTLSLSLFSWRQYSSWQQPSPNESKLVYTTFISDCTGNYFQRSLFSLSWHTSHELHYNRKNFIEKKKRSNIFWWRIKHRLRSSVQTIRWICLYKNEKVSLLESKELRNDQIFSHKRYANISNKNQWRLSSINDVKS